MREASPPEVNVHEIWYEKECCVNHKNYQTNVNLDNVKEMTSKCGREKVNILMKLQSPRGDTI